MTTLATNLGNAPEAIVFDGSRIWIANNTSSISIVTPGASIPWTVTTLPLGSAPAGAIYDGASVWITDQNQNVLRKLDQAGAVLQTVTVGTFPQRPVFDGANIWVPNFAQAANSISVVRASSGAVLATLTSGLNFPIAGAFDGQRVLFANPTSASVTMFKAADLTLIGSFETPVNPSGICSDGLNFWLTAEGGSLLMRF